MIRRKIYNKLVEWKRSTNGTKALLIEGARRIGKSTIVEEFGKNEYKSYIMIDFNKASKRVKSLFDDISYPEGFVYEDTGTTYKLVCKSSCTYFLDHALYYYCVRPDSITTFVSPKVLNDRARLNSQRYRDLGTWGYHSEILDYRIKHFALWYLIRKKRDFSDANYTFLYRTLRCGFHVPKRFSKKQTAQWLLFRLSPLLFDLYYTLKGKKI